MELFEHQKTGIAFLKEKKKAILADEMGLGKTIQAIMASGQSEGGVIVVCPASLKINWKREIESVYPGAVIKIISSKDMEMEDASDSWHIINYDILEKKSDVIESLIENGAKTLILDEAHYIKGKSQRASVVVGGMIKKGESKKKYPGIASKMENVYCLTGTPLLNRPIELFNLLKAIDHPLGKNRSEYAKRYCGAFFMVRVKDLTTNRQFMTEMKKAYKYYGDRKKYIHLYQFLDESGASNIPELHSKIKGAMLRRKKDDVLDLPGKLPSVKICEMNEEWRRAYDKAFDDYIEYLRENPDPKRDIENILSARDLVELQKLKQVCSTSKIDRIVEDIEKAVEQDQKIIVFSQYTNTINKIEELLNEKKIKTVTLTGADDLNARQKSVDEFQNNDKTKVFIGNIKAAGVGITLTKASIIIFADMDWSPEIHAQAEDRADRIGQKRMVNVYYYVIEDTVEEDIMSMLAEKDETIKHILEGKHVKQKSNKAFKVFAEKLNQKVTNRVS